MISVYKIESSYVTIRKYRGAPAPMVPTPMNRNIMVIIYRPDMVIQCEYGLIRFTNDCSKSASIEAELMNEALICKQYDIVMIC